MHFDLPSLGTYMYLTVALHSTALHPVHRHDMADFLTAVKTTVKGSSDNSEQLLTAISTHSIDARPAEQAKSHQEFHITTRKASRGEIKTNDAYQSNSEPLRTPEEILQVLQSQPSINALVRVFRHLQPSDGVCSEFSIDALGPPQAQIINALVSSIVPNFWPILDPEDKKLSTSCLQNIAGISAVVARIRLLTEALTNNKSSGSDELVHLLELVGQIFEKRSLVARVWLRLYRAVSDPIKQSLSWKEFVSLIGSGKVVTTIARAEDALKTASVASKPSWLSNGSEYAAWLGRMIVLIASEAPGRVRASYSSHTHLSDSSGSEERVLETAACRSGAHLLAKAFTLGYSVPLVRGLFQYVASPPAIARLDAQVLKSTVVCCQSFTQRQFLESTLQWLTQVSPSDVVEFSEAAHSQAKVKCGLAACLDLLISDHVTMQQLLLSFIADASLSSTISVPVRRAVIVTLATNVPNELQALLEKLFTTFGDQMFISHAPIVQQESIAQTLLLTASYLHRSAPMAVLMTARSSGHMSGTSNRLHSSNSRARWLGMVVATAISFLVDKEGSRMSFGTDELRTAEGKWYQDLVKVKDEVGSFEDFVEVLQSQSKLVKHPRAKAVNTQELPILNGKQTFGPVRPPAQTEVDGERVTEILDDDDALESDHDDSLTPYAKPDSDAEDSDEDATLVNRNKSRPPVYIRDLMRMLREDKDHDKFQLAIKHAAPLIRRKINFGREVKDHAEELALLLSDLQDPFDTDGFEELKLQSLIAVLLSDVEKLAPWLSRRVFEGDYSLSQRCIMLSALGLGGRELAGLQEPDHLNPALEHTSFPSKQLPSRLHATYSPTVTKALHTATTSVEQSIMRPLALSAADRSTSHLDAVKIKRFSARRDSEQPRTQRKPTPNQLARIFMANFFNPLVTRYQQDLAAYRQRSPFATPVLLTTFLKTISILLHASGPSTTGLADITFTFWDVLHSLRVASLSDISILEAILFGLLTLLEVNCEWGNVARLAQEEPKRLAETQHWVQMVFERTGSGGLVDGNGNGTGDREEGRVRRLAAGVLMRCGEIVEGYQKDVMGIGRR